jgi:hypothetical protein
MQEHTYVRRSQAELLTYMITLKTFYLAKTEYVPHFLWKSLKASLKTREKLLLF